MTHPQTQDDEALAEVMARAMVESDIRRHSPSWSDEDVAYHMSRITYGAHLRHARAALTALRNHEGRKG